MLIVISTLVLGLILLGFSFRRTPKVHIPCMLTAFALDLGLVLYIEFSRQAVERVSQEIQHPSHWLLLFHVLVSVTVLVLYVVMLRLGLKLFKGEESQRHLHRRLGFCFLVCRLSNYVTSFWVINS